MPAVANNKSTARFVVRSAWGLLAVVVVAQSAAAQLPKPTTPPGAAPEPTRAGAVKLPDGTVVFFTKNPDDPNPPLDGVLLSPQEYKTLLDQADQLKKLKSAPKPHAPSACHLQTKVELRGNTSVAVVTARFEFRTTTPNMLVALGGQRAFPTAAKLDGGRMPVLSSSDDGLTVLIEAPGEHSLSLDLEVPIGPRGAKGEVGFEFGLPRAAITTLDLTPPGGVASVTVNKLTRTTDKPLLPLGPADAVEVTWAAPTTPTPVGETTATAEADVSVRVDDTQVETLIRVRLKGSAKEWPLVLPPNADVAAERVGTMADDSQPPPAESVFPSSVPAIIRPTDPAKPIWTFRPPEGSGSEWVVTASVHQARPKPTESKFRGPYPIGPLAVPIAARLTGQIRVYAPPTIRLGFQAGTEVRRQDAPPPEEDLVAGFKFTTIRTPSAGPSPTPLLQIDARTAPGFLRIEPDHTLRRTDAGWRLQSEIRVTPVRTDADHVTVALPIGWDSFAAGPPELVVGVDEPTVPKGGLRSFTIRLAAPQKNPFSLTLSAGYRTDAAETVLSLPRFPAPEAIEHAVRVQATVPDGLVVHGTVTGADGEATALRPTDGATDKPTAAVSGRFDRGVSQVALGWQKYRPELVAECRAEVSIQVRQILIQQTLTLPPVGGAPIRFRGSPELVDLQSQPRLTPTGRRGEWILPAGSPTTESKLVVSFALPLSGTEQSAPTPVPIELLWPSDATRLTTRLRVWNECGYHLHRASGPWRELAAEASPERDSLPWRTLTGVGIDLPLSIRVGPPDEDDLPTATVERGLIQAWLTPDGGLAVRGRFVIGRWSPAGITLEVPSSVAAEVGVDGKRVDLSPLQESEGLRKVSVPLPARMSDRSTVTLDVKYAIPAARSTYGKAILTPPRPTGVVFRTPARWQVLTPPGMTVLQQGHDLIPESRWAWQHGMIVPIPASDSHAVEHWLATGEEVAGGEIDPAPPSGMVGRQPALKPVTIYLVPQTGWVAGCSLVVLIIGLAVFRLRSMWFGPALAVLGVSIAAAAVVWPQPAAEAAAAAQPGAVALVAILGIGTTVRWYYRRRITHLPGFTPFPSAADSGTVAFPTVPASTGSHTPALPAPASSRRSSQRPPVPSTGR